MQLADTAARLTADSNVRAVLRVGPEYPSCDTSSGEFLNARAFGTLDVTRTEGARWQARHGVELASGMDIQAYGLEIVRHETAPTCSAAYAAE